MTTQDPRPGPARDRIDQVRRHALTYPGAHEDHPWGETVVKVDGKVFAFLGHPNSPPGLSVKLPRTGNDALMLPVCTPTGYGLGRGGWVTARFAPDDRPPLDMLLAWLDESYRAVAKKKRVAELDTVRPPDP